MRDAEDVLICLAKICYDDDTPLLLHPRFDDSSINLCAARAIQRHMSNILLLVVLRFSRARSLTAVWTVRDVWPLDGMNT